MKSNTKNWCLRTKRAVSSFLNQEVHDKFITKGKRSRAQEDQFRCALINLHMLACEDVGSVHCIRALPDLVVVVDLKKFLPNLLLI